MQIACPMSCKHLPSFYLLYLMYFLHISLKSQICWSWSSWSWSLSTQQFRWLTGDQLVISSILHKFWHLFHFKHDLKCLSFNLRPNLPIYMVYFYRKKAKRYQFPRADVTYPPIYRPSSKRMAPLRKTVGQQSMSFFFFNVSRCGIQQSVPYLKMRS